MKEKKLNANAGGVAPMGDIHFEEQTLDKNSPTLYSNPKSKIKTLASDHRAITLIALIITIIVMLLLVGVTLNVALQGGLFGNAKEASLGQAHSMVMELLKTEEFTYLTEKESGKTTLALIDYLKEKGIITEETEDKYKINVEVLLGTAGRTGNGTDGKDVYKLEKSDRDEELGKKETKIKAMTIAKNPETKSNDNTGTKYVVNYYDNNGTAEKVGELYDLYGVELITFYIDEEPYTAEKGMTWLEWIQSSFCPVELECSYDDINHRCTIMGGGVLVEELTRFQRARKWVSLHDQKKWRVCFPYI